MTNRSGAHTGAGFGRGVDALLTLLIVGVVIAVLWSRTLNGPSGGPGDSQSPTQVTEPTSAPIDVTAIPSPTPLSSFGVEIEAGLQVAWNAEDAAVSTLHQIGLNERLAGGPLAPPRILSVSAWVGKDVPAQFAEGTVGAWPIVWVVQAQGTFVTYSCPIAPCPSSSSGWYMFDDAGNVVGSGFPLPGRT